MGAVQRFQQSQGQPANGVLTLSTHLALRVQACNAPPAVRPPTGGDTKRICVLLPRGGEGFIVKSGSHAVHQYGTERTINRLLVGLGHSKGIAVDIGLFRKDKKNLGATYHDPVYDRELTQKLVTILGRAPMSRR